MNLIHPMESGHSVITLTRRYNEASTGSVKHNCNDKVRFDLINFSNVKESVNLRFLLCSPWHIPCSSTSSSSSSSAFFCVPVTLNVRYICWMLRCDLLWYSISFLVSFTAHPMNWKANCNRRIFIKSPRQISRESFHFLFDLKSKE